MIIWIKEFQTSLYCSDAEAIGFIPCWRRIVSDAVVNLDHQPWPFNIDLNGDPLLPFGIGLAVLEAVFNKSLDQEWLNLFAIGFTENTNTDVNIFKPSFLQIDVVF